MELFQILTNDEDGDVLAIVWAKDEEAARALASRSTEAPVYINGTPLHVERVVLADAPLLLYANYTLSDDLSQPGAVSG